jgi:HSP20 family protein
MVDTKLPIRTDDNKPAAAALAFPTLDELRREVDRVFDDFGRGGWMRPFRALNLEPVFRRGFTVTAPAVDIVEKDTAFELTAELPGMTGKDVDVSIKNGNLVIKGEKQEHKEEKSEGYYVKERQYGSFERSFAVPEGVDPSAIEATYLDGILKVTLPKTTEAQKPAKKIEIKAA